ncbi:MAG: hypothetical protein J7L44_02885 [Candidatus Diapherotrites archaeon]|nr:hypothetical protein [Candidatus Diapherotrites archaeon]
MNAKGSIASNVILWIAVAIACGIATYWFLQHFFSAQGVFEIMNNDLFVLSSKLNENCDANYYFFSYNPRTEQGLLTIDVNSVCIETKGIKKCATLYCGPTQPKSFELDKLTYIEIEKNSSTRVRAK